MRSGWPHTQGDQGRVTVDQRQVQFGPEVSWPTGYSELEYRDGDYRYPARHVAPAPAAQPRAVNPQGEHPYAGTGAGGYAVPGGPVGPDVDAFGYGDPGYSDPGYDGPASQDAGIAGVRTVRGLVEPGHAGPGRQRPGYPATYQQPWDYDQPLRDAGDEQSHLVPDGYGAAGYDANAYNPADYNGSEYSRPGIEGPGYDLSGIIGTSEFPEIGYDQPEYGRLAYDDPRYADAPRHDLPRGADTRFDLPAVSDSGPGYGDLRHYDTRFDLPAADMPRRDDTRFDVPAIGGPRRDDTRFDVPAVDMPRRDDTRFDLPAVADYDETRLDHDWPPEEDPGGAGPGYPNGGYAGDGMARSGYADPRYDGAAAFYDARPDLGEPRMDRTSFDMPAIDDFRGEPRFDDARFGNMQAPPTDFRAVSTGLLAPPEEELNWADEMSPDTFDGAGADAPEVPAAFTRTARREAARDNDTRARRISGKRRGRSGDRRQWMALGAIAVVMAGAIGGVLMKTVFSGPGGPAHSVAAPSQVSAFTREPNLEQQMNVNQVRANIIKGSAGQASDVVSAVYQEGSSAPGSNPQIFMFVGGKLASADPSASITNFTHNYRDAAVVPAGPLGGEAACGEATANNEAVSMCVWFDNDTFGALVSPTMTTAKLASTLDTVRPGLEQVTQ